MRDKKSYLLYPNCGYCVYYMIQYKVISKKYKKEAVFLGKVLEYAANTTVFSGKHFILKRLILLKNALPSDGPDLSFLGAGRVATKKGRS